MTHCAKQVIERYKVFSSQVIKPVTCQVSEIRKIYPVRFKPNERESNQGKPRLISPATIGLAYRYRWIEKASHSFFSWSVLSSEHSLSRENMCAPELGQFMESKHPYLVGHFSGPGSIDKWKS
ncbi:hypothetical protein QL285_031958 [Trifolium repens]|nr:hypothetical protein QL285_031958 [Trifolium repens]